MSYVDGYVLPLPKKNIKAYQRIANQAGRIWKEHGALDYKECIGDDLKIQGLVPFTKAAKAKPSETIVFAYVLFKSRKHRDAVNARVMKDPRLQEMCNPGKMPFDVNRMVCGGFKVFVDPK